MATVTNRKAAQAVRGQSVWVTLDATDSAQLDDFTIGDECTIPGSKTGYIDFIDTYGHSFRVKPDMPINGFSSQNTNGYLAVSTVVTVS